MPVENNPFVPFIRNASEITVQRGYATTRTARPATVVPAREPVASTRPASIKQYGFIASLFTDRKWDDHKWAARMIVVRGEILAFLAKIDLGAYADATDPVEFYGPLDAVKASALITELKACAFAPRPVEVKFPEVPAGRTRTRSSPRSRRTRPPPRGSMVRRPRCAGCAVATSPTRRRATTGSDPSVGKTPGGDLEHFPPGRGCIPDRACVLLIRQARERPQRT